MAFCLIVMALQIYLASLCLGKLSCKFALEIILCGKLSTTLISWTFVRYTAQLSRASRFS